MPVPKVTRFIIFQLLVNINFSTKFLKLEKISKLATPPKIENTRKCIGLLESENKVAVLLQNLSREEMRGTLRFLHAKCKSQTELHIEIKQIYGDNGLSKSIVYRVF